MSRLFRCPEQWVDDMIPQGKPPYWWRAPDPAHLAEAAPFYRDANTPCEPEREVLSPQQAEKSPFFLRNKNEPT